MLIKAYSINFKSGYMVLGFGFAIEKCWQSGRERLERHGWIVHSVVELESIADNAVVFRDRG